MKGMRSPIDLLQVFSDTQPVQLFTRERQSRLSVGQVSCANLISVMEERTGDILWIGKTIGGFLAEYILDGDQEPARDCHHGFGTSEVRVPAAQTPSSIEGDARWHGWQRSPGRGVSPSSPLW